MCVIFALVSTTYANARSNLIYYSHTHTKVCKKIFFAPPLNRNDERESKFAIQILCAAWINKKQEVQRENEEEEKGPSPKMNLFYLQCHAQKRENVSSFLLSFHLNIKMLAKSVHVGSAIRENKKPFFLLI